MENVPRRLRAIIALSAVPAWCACAAPLQPTPGITQYAHAAIADRDRPSGSVRVRLPLIEGHDIRFTRYSTEQGLSHSRVDHMLQDAQGFLWIGTYNGLNRFDGYRFHIYKPQPNDPDSVGGVMIYSLFQDRSGILWVGV